MSACRFGWRHLDNEVLAEDKVSELFSKITPYINIEFKIYNDWTEFPAL